MRKHKLIWLGVSFLLFVFVFVFVKFSPETSAADPFNLYYISSQNQIGGNFKNHNFVFNLASPAASSAWTFQIASSNSPICPNSLITNVNPNNLGKQNTPGNTSNFKYMADGSACTSSNIGKATTYNGSLTIGQSQGGGTGSGGGGTTSNPKPINWNGAKGVITDSAGAHLTVNFSDGTSMDLTDNSPSDTTYNYKPASAGKFGGTVVSNWCSNTLLSNTGGDTAHGINMTSHTSPTATVNLCYYSDSAPNKQINQSSISIPIDSSAFGKDPSGSATQTTCEANANGFSFAWAVCPMLDAASKLSDTLLGYFEDQLSFSVAQLGTAGSQVQHSWSLIKDICSALLVLIMLAMVLSQAVSIGPFDAYTIRKLLPRLIVVVILMQISWNLFAYVITLVNDIAKGLADIMYLPFGGSNNMGLFNLLGHANLGGVELGVLNWAAIGVGIALGIAFLFTMLGVAFTAIVALLFALLTLVFRKILIIVLLIFSPLALLAWVLPGTERYWKMWRENFFKVLFMYPLLVAIIAAGRVFAYIVGSQNNGEFLNLIFILVGFFGPLFLAPRTFKWGGQFMQAAGNGIMKASEKVNERPKKFLDTRQEGWRQLRRNKSASRIGSYLSDRNQGKPISTARKAGLFMRGDLFRAGILDPTLGIPMKVPTVKNGKLTTKRIGNERRKSQEAEFINAKEEISSAEAGKFGRMIDAETRGFGNDKKKIVDYLNRRLANTEAETDGTLRYVLVDRLARFKESERLHELLDAGSPLRMPDADSIASGMYDSLKGLDPSLVQGNYEVADEVLSGMTGNAWVRFAQRDMAGAEAAYARIVNNPGLRARLDYSAAGKLAAMGINIPTGSPGAPTATAAAPAATPTGATTPGAATATPGATVRTGGAVRPPGSVTSTPGELKISHQETVNVNLPDASQLADATQREAYKVRLQTDPSAVQALANGLAYDLVQDKDEHFAVLDEMRRDILNVPAGTSPDQTRVERFNQMLDEVNRAYSQRIAQTAQAAADRGHDPTAARTAAQNRLAPEMINDIESRRI